MTSARHRPLVVVAHGTRDPDGPRVLEDLVARVRSRLPGVDVHLAYVDVIGPTLRDVLAELVRDVPAEADRVDAVVVPLFLASGYHVRVDIPQAVTSTGVRAAVTPALGPDVEVVAAVADRLAEAGHREGDAVVLAAAGSSDPDALAEVEAAARMLGTSLGASVTVGYAATATPSVHDAVATARTDAPTGRVAVASYLLAPGLFQRRLDEAGGDVVAGPIGAHPRVVDLIVRRYTDGYADAG